MINNIFKFFLRPVPVSPWAVYLTGVWLTMVYILVTIRWDSLDALIVGLVWPLYWFMWLAVTFAGMLK